MNNQMPKRMISLFLCSMVLTTWLDHLSSPPPPRCHSTNIFGFLTIY